MKNRTSNNKMRRFYLKYDKSKKTDNEMIIRKIVWNQLGGT